MTCETILEKIEENMDKIREYGVKRIGLFGSYNSKENYLHSRAIFEVVLLA